jgi:hypothetical protein
MVKRTGKVQIKIRYDGEIPVRLPLGKILLIVGVVLGLVILGLTGDSTILQLFN